MAKYNIVLWCLVYVMWYMWYIMPDVYSANDVFVCQGYIANCTSKHSRPFDSHRQITENTTSLTKIPDTLVPAKIMALRHQSFGRPPGHEQIQVYPGGDWNQSQKTCSHFRGPNSRFPGGTCPRPTKSKRF